MLKKKFKVCPACKKNKSIGEFHKHRNRSDGVAVQCKECVKKWSKEYRQKNKKQLLKQSREYYKKHKKEISARSKKYRERNKLKYKEYHLKNEHGITLNEYNKILKQQNECCAICGKHFSSFKRALAVDHNHQTEKIRGLLCGYCNYWLLRAFRDKKILWGGFVKYAQKALKEDKDWI